MAGRRAGFTFVELMVSMVLSLMVGAGIYRFWTTATRQSKQIQDRTEARNQITVSAIRLQRSLSNAGLGINDSMRTIFKYAGTASDTLLVYSNPRQSRITLVDSCAHGDTLLYVTDTIGFGLGYMGIYDHKNQEYHRIKRIRQVSGRWEFTLTSPVDSSFKIGVPDIYPVTREVFYSDTGSNLIALVNDVPSVVSTNTRNFRVALTDKNGAATANYLQVRAITFSLMGVYDPSDTSATGNSLTFSSTVIPRNTI